MKSTLAKWGFILVLAGGSGCSSVDLCTCEAEAQLSDPDRATMSACAELYEDKSFEEIEAELLECAAERARKAKKAG